MKNKLVVLAAALPSAVWPVPQALAQTPCVTQNFVVPPRANTSDKAAPFFVDTTGLDFKTQPPTCDPKNPTYPRATELADGTLPPAGAEGNFIIGPTHAPAPETIAKEGIPKGTTVSFTLSSKDSTIHNPGLIRDDVAACGNSSIMIATTAQGDKSNMIVTTSHPGTWTRTIEVYVPPNYARGMPARFIVIGDGVEGREHHPRQPDPAAPRAADGRDPHRRTDCGLSRPTAMLRLLTSTGKPATHAFDHIAVIGLGSVASARRTVGAQVSRVVRGWTDCLLAARSVAAA